MTHTTRLFYVSSDVDILGRTFEADTPEAAVQAAISAGALSAGDQATVRWDVRLGAEPGTWHSARITTIDVPAARIVSAPPVAEPAPVSVKAAPQRVAIA